MNPLDAARILHSPALVVVVLLLRCQSQIDKAIVQWIAVDVIDDETFWNWAAIHFPYYALGAT